jgi:transcription termination factor NusB
MRKINYSSKNFLDYRTELINYVRQYYPNLLSDFNDSSIGMMLIELNAAIGDNLSNNTDRMFQETQLAYAQERSSILSMARTLGLKIPGKRPAITIVDLSVNVPVSGDSFDVRYAPLIRKGAQVSGGGKIFETLEDVDFSSPFTSGGIPNRLVLPNVDSNQKIVDYTITKREIVVNGSTQVYKRVISSEDSKPFFEVVLPADDVLSIESVVLLEGTNYSGYPTYSEFYDFENRYFEVEALAEDKVFIEDDNRISDNSGIIPGKWVRIDKKFITEITDKGFTKLIFGGGQTDVGSLKEFGVNDSLVNKIGDFINNTSLGTTLKAGHTLFVEYRVGGGSGSNIGSNVLQSINTVDMFVNGPDNTKNSRVKKTLTVNNPIPAMGGKDEPSIEEIRNLVRYNYSSQNRAVTLKDYQSRISLMPSQYGVPFRSLVTEEQNKVVINILGQDAQGRLTNKSTNTLKENIAEYLSDYRSINDYVEIRDGKIINLGFDIDLHVDKEFPKSQIISETIRVVKEYMDINKHEMGDNIYLSQLIDVINKINGVMNVIDIRVFNKVGDGKYSLNEISQKYIDEESRQINLMGEFTLFGEATSMMEVKFPEKDIRVRVKE